METTRDNSMSAAPVRWKAPGNGRRDDRGERAMASQAFHWSGTAVETVMGISRIEYQSDEAVRFFVLVI